MLKRLVPLIIITTLVVSGYLILNPISPKIEKPTYNFAGANESSKQPTPQDWLVAINKKRLEAGIPPLQLDARLNTSSQQKADEMLKEGLDDSPHENSQGVHGYTYAIATAHCIYASENILWGFDDIESGLDWWMNSPAHKAAILDPKYKTTGFGIVDGYTVEHFCQI